MVQEAFETRGMEIKRGEVASEELCSNRRFPLILRKGGYCIWNYGIQKEVLYLDWV